jgi:GDP-D-mannose dehydratase
MPQCTRTFLTNVLSWEGCGVDEVGINEATGSIVVRVDPYAYQLPSHNQLGDPSKAEHKLGWKRTMSLEVSSDVSDALCVHKLIVKKDTIWEMTRAALAVNEGTIS